ncbi:MAG: SDR family NAD(P)-dependent oxidoreductase [Gemmatimonadetes bacterium]|nr:SDR family NAD(P)-dependent oxidoreductase [Gemmatimonadota bacterium]
MTIDRPVSFVTGASSGLGMGLALRFAAEGHAVALAARRVDRLDELVERIRAAGGTALACPCDVRDRDQVHAAVARAEAELGPVDLLIASAGVGKTTAAQNLDAADLEWILGVNVLGSAYAVEAVLPGMLARRRGHLVGIGSLAGYGGLPKTAAYSASKGALKNYFESLRLDLRGTGVAVTVITPGYVKTELTAKNAHPMPQLMELGDAVDVMTRAIQRRAPHCAFPRPLSTLTWLGQVFPRRLYDAVASGVRREKKE